MIRVGDVEGFLDQWAPFSSAEDWDNVGLLVGNREMTVTGILTALDITPKVIVQAQKAGANVVVAHHPVIFAPLRRIDSCSVPSQLLAAGMAALCVHTNMDRAPGGVNDILAAQLGLSDIREEEGLCRTGTLSREMAPEDFAAHVMRCLGTAVRISPGNAMVHSVGLCSGAGGDYLLHLAELGVQGLITGEIKHHEWLELSRCGATVVEAGHFDTEIGIAAELARRLSEAFTDLTVVQAVEQCPYRTLSQ